MMQNVSIYFIPFFIGLLSIIVTAIITIIYAIGSITPNFSYSSYIFMFVPYIFASIFFFYVLVYLISSAVGNWFYEQPSIAAFAGCPSVFNHIGSFTFAALIITFMRVLRAIIDHGARTTDNLYCCICLCLVKYCLACIEAILQTLNHFAVIVMSFTGQDFIDSAKTGSVLLTSDIPLFAIISTV